MALGFGFNKAKVLASAERFVQQGKIQNAISEYEKIIKEDPKDLTVQNTVGDLYLRIGQNEHAAMYFKKVGDQYALNGFTVKSIAVYKKLAKLVPNNAEYITRLAELYTQQGLFNDARAQYMQIADGLLRSGDNTQAARIFQRILELDPENAHMQAKLADLYMKIGKKDEARNIFFSAAESLYARGTYEAAAEALNKVISLDPHNADALLLRGMIAAGSEDYRSAITYLEQVPDLESRPDGLRALLNARLQSNSEEGAESVATRLLNVHNDASGLNSMAEWYINNNHVSQALAIYQQHGQKLFSGGSGSAKDTLYPLIDRVRDNPAALNMLMGLLGQSGDTGHTAEILELQANASAQKGDYAEARDLYKKLTELEPENALHSQNYRQMLAKLGEDSATRILSPEEAAQALMVEELDEGAAVVHQKYDAPTETAIETALTDAELFVSYNVPSKAIPPLEAALPLAPHDVALNQRLAMLYAKAERWADAAKVCQTLSEIYRELGHEKESTRYLEASRKYALRAGPGVVSKPVSVARTPQPSPAPVIPVSAAPPAPPAFEASHAAGEGSVQEFSFDIPEHIVTEPEIAAPIQTEIVHETVSQEIELEPASPEPTPVSPEVMLSPVPAAEEEIDLSNEWENMLSVEDEESVPAAEPEQPTVAAHHEKSSTEAAAVDEPQGGSSVCYLPDEKIDEIKFYISQQMWDAAKARLLELQEIAPDAPQIMELMAAVAAGQSKPSESRPAQAFAASTLEKPPLDYLPPPFAAPVPRVVVENVAQENVAPEPVSMQEFSAPEPVISAVPQYAEPISRDPLLDLPIEEPRASDPFQAEHHEPAPAPKDSARPIKSEQPAAQSTEDILGDFVLDLESTELADFAPRPPQPEPAVAPKAAPVPVPQPAVAASVGSSLRNGHAAGEMQGADTSATLSDILSDLQEETAEPSVAEEDPETHYNLGIAFKEMGLLDEAIGELQKVCRGIDQGKSFSQPIQAYTWLAQCLVDKGVPEAALRWYQKALQLPGLDDGSRNAIYYDLAAAYEASGDRKSALANFMEVYGSNIDFRDVASRIKSLKS